MVGRELGGSGSNADSQIQSLMSCQLDDPRSAAPTIPGLDGSPAAPLASTADMGSLIKKRRKRMRKKKHKKMLKATRWQRRAGK